MEETESCSRDAATLLSRSPVRFAEQVSFESVSRTQNDVTNKSMFLQISSSTSKTRLPAPRRICRDSPRGPADQTRRLPTSTRPSSAPCPSKSTLFALWSFDGTQPELLLRQFVETLQLNKPVCSFLTRELFGQAEIIIEKLQAISNVDDKWKLMTILVGGNDMCDFCEEPVRFNSVVL